jgi:hypothetical protein
MTPTITQKELTDVFQLLDEQPSPVRKATRARHCEDGVTELVDSQGMSVRLMPTEDWEAMVRWQEYQTHDD